MSVKVMWLYTVGFTKNWKNKESHFTSVAKLYIFCLGAEHIVTPKKTLVRFEWEFIREIIRFLIYFEAIMTRYLPKADLVAVSQSIYCGFGFTNENHIAFKIGLRMR